MFRRPSVLILSSGINPFKPQLSQNKGPTRRAEVETTTEVADEEAPESGEPRVSRFSDILNERMRELRSEKHRDFRITTHIAKAPQQKQEEEQLQDTMFPHTAEEQASFSFLDEYDGEDQSLSGAAGSAHQIHAGSSSGGSSLPSLVRAIQRAGLCSRRAAVDLVSQGKIKVDGVVARDPFQQVAATSDIHVDGHRGRLRFAPPRLWAFHKPAFVSVSGGDGVAAEQRPLWRRYAQMLGFDHLVPVGSLPTRSHGLLMLTNDGELARWLEHPSTRVQSTYVYRVRPAIDHALAMRLNTHGVSIGGVQHHEFEFHPFTGGRSRHAIRIKVQMPLPQRRAGAIVDENMQPLQTPMPVVQMLESLQRKIVRGGRVSYGPFTLRKLAPGGIKEVSVPPYYMKYVNPVFMPFIERDWAYFRRLRVQRLMRMARWRHLNDRETEEVEAFSCDELRQVFSSASGDLSVSSSAAMAAVEEEARIFAEGLIETPDVTARVKFDPSSSDDEATPGEGTQIPWQL